MAAICFYRSRAVFDWYERFLWYVGTPFLVLAPVFAAQKKWGRRLLALAVICAVVLLVMTGCAPAELEDRDFPIEIAVRDTKDAGLAWYEAEQAGNRMVDYSHLKVLILEQEFVEDEAARAGVARVFEGEERGAAQRLCGGHGGCRSTAGAE